MKNSHQNRKKLLLVGTIVLSTVFLVACTNGSDQPGSFDNQVEDVSTEKVGDTSITGVIFIQNDQAYIRVDGQINSLDSYTVDFSEYEGQEVIVIGQYSGDTLFVSQIE